MTAILDDCEAVPSPLGMPVGTLAAAAAAGALLAALVVTAALAAGGSAYEARPLHLVAVDGPSATPAEQSAERRLAALEPRGLYLTVDTARNRLRVWRGREQLREAICSTGTGTVLRDPRNGRTWVFDTPLGERRVVDRRRDPVWTKPEWAFVEEGFLPPSNPADRRDDFSLGDVALDLGDGYLIHGTLFQSLLGRSATHGCIRLGDEDLAYVFRTVPVGTPVYLY